jgi:hypothetical protein
MSNETELPYGPRRKAPAFYAGEAYQGHPLQYPDVERYPNGALPARRDKLARRIIRGALKKRFSSLTKSLRLAQGLRAQAYEAARDEQPKGAKRGRWARRLLARELAIHQPVYAPTKKELRKTRTQKRKDARAGKVDAIGQLVDAMAKKP